MLNKRKYSFLIAVLALTLMLCLLASCNDAEEATNVGETESPTGESVEVGSNDTVVDENDANVCKHSPVTDALVLPTCTQSGLTQGEHCIDCGAILLEQTVVPALGHSPEVINGAPATCTSDGLGEGERCSACQEVLTEQEIIPALGHSIAVDDEISASCTQPGLSRGEHCTACREIIIPSEPTPPIGHKYGDATFTWNAFEAVATFVCENNASHKEIIDATVTSEITLAPTSDNDGVRTYTAVVEHEGKAYTDTKTEKLFALGHSFEFDGWEWNGNTARAVLTCTTEENHKEYIEAHVTSNVTLEPTCTLSGTRAYTASVSYAGSTYSDIKEEEILASGHSEIPHNALAPTCTANGWSAYVTCKSCDYTTFTALDALGHDDVEHKAQAPSCTSAGWSAYKACSRCAYTTYSEINALGHDEISKSGKPATCTEKGYNSYVSCSRCDYSTYSEIKALGHDEQKHDAHPATCTEGGFEAYVTCTRCDYTTYKTIEALEHSITTHGALSPTCSSVGWNAYEECSRCNYTTYSEIGILAHTYDDCHDAGCNNCSYSRGVTITSTVFDTVGIDGKIKAYSSESGTKLGTVTMTHTGTNTILLTGIGQNITTTITATGNVTISSGSVVGYGYYLDGVKAGVTREDGSMSISASVSFQSIGTHTITIVAYTDKGYAVSVATWNIDIAKPTANVIVIAGQSNAVGASPVTQAVKNSCAGKDFSNVYIHYDDINWLGTEWGSWFSNDSFQPYVLGLGGQGYCNYIGPELGIICHLIDNGYVSSSEPLYVIKYAAAGTFLNGQWMKTSGTNHDPNGLVEDMGGYLYDLMVDYVYDSLNMIPNTYDKEIKSLFWIQGESDASDINTANQYKNTEKTLVNNFRSEFASYAPASGISFINYAIQETAEGNIHWGNPGVVNAGKQANCEYYYNKDNSSHTPTNPDVTSNPGLDNSYLVIADSLLCKGSVYNSSNEGWGDNTTDFAHLCGESMLELGIMMGQGMLFLESQG